MPADQHAAIVQGEEARFYHPCSGPADGWSTECPPIPTELHSTTIPGQGRAPYAHNLDISAIGMGNSQRDHDLDPPANDFHIRCIRWHACPRGELHGCPDGHDGGCTSCCTPMCKQVDGQGQCVAVAGCVGSQCEDSKAKSEGVIVGNSVDFRMASALAGMIAVGMVMWML